MEHTTSMKNLVIKLLLWSVAMFIFAIWIMPPIYNVFCEITGLNGKTGGKYQATSTVVDINRFVNVQFITTKNESIPWQFEPAVRTLKVNPGAQYQVNFIAKNTTGEAMVGQAIPSVVPFKASGFFHKTECFCFEQQPLAAGEQAILPMMFIIDSALPEHIKTITLSYTLFDITEPKQALLSNK